MSQLLQKIERDLNATNTPSDRGILLARKSAYLARIGKFNDARLIVAELRREFGEANSSSVTVWVMLAEGLIHYYENLSSQAQDRVARAQLLSKAMGDNVLAALTSAWLAHLEFEHSDFAGMAASIESALRLTSSTNYAARTRVAMVLSDCYFLCGDRVNGQKWFMRSRESALKEGDQASIEALLYNKAAFTLARLRAQSCFGSVDPEQLSLLRLELSSARNLQDITNIKALAQIVHLCDARLLLLEGKFDQAEKKLISVRNAAPFAEYNFKQEFIDLEIDYCRHNLGSDRVKVETKNWAFDDLDIDEQLTAAWLIVEIFSGRVDKSELDSMSKRLNDKKSNYAKTIQNLKNLLEPFSDA